MTFKEMLMKESMSLIVSLPKNDIKYAKAAWENGADAIKVHLNVGHYASGSVYANLEGEWENLKEILEKSPVPVGVVLGEGTSIIRDDFEAISNAGFDFMSVYYDHAPTDILAEDKMVKTVAINATYQDVLLESFKHLGIEAIEMSVMAHEDYGKPLTVKDVAHYAHIIRKTQLPTILPTQKHVEIEDIQVLKNIGVKCLMIGAIVTGVEIEGYGQIVSQYAQEIHK